MASYAPPRHDGVHVMPGAPRVGLCGFTVAMDDYPRHFPVVEVQQTFYEPPANTTLQRWANAMPPGFELTIKAWQLVTHLASSPTYRRTKKALTDKERADCGFFNDTKIVEHAHARSVECARILGATAMLFQCPASFVPSDANFARMQAYFRRPEHAPPSIGSTGARLRYLWEPRGPRWVAACREARALADELGLVHVVDPFVTAHETGRPIYFRLHGIGRASHSYTDQELERLAGTVLAGTLDESQSTEGEMASYVMFNNLPRLRDAIRFIALLRKRAPSSRNAVLGPRG